MGNFQVVPLMESHRIPCTCTGRIVSKLNQSGMGWVKIIENSGAQKWDGRDMLGFFNQSSNLTYFPSKLEKKHRFVWKKNSTPFNLMVESQHHHTPHHSIWANYNNSHTWNKAILGWFPLLTMIPVRSQWGRYNSPRFNGRSMRYMTPSFADNPKFLLSDRQGNEHPKKGLGEMMYVWTPAHSHESLTIKYRNMVTMNHETKTWGKAKNTALKYWTTELAKKDPKRSTLWLFNIAMENDHLQFIFPLKMVIFYSYVSLP